MGVTTKKSLPSTLMLISLTSDGNLYNQDFLGNYALINIKDKLALKLNIECQFERIEIYLK